MPSFNDFGCGNDECPKRFNCDKFINSKKYQVIKNLEDVCEDYKYFKEIEVTMSNMKKLRVSHFPQIPCKPFIVEVKSLEEAKKVYEVLANYDLFQYKNRIKPDYSNMTCVEEWDEQEQEWLSWCDEKTGIDNLEEYFEYINDKVTKS